tara:strand:+ start:60 stop:512 length:453 start_codon:yes stop_codon:yes gene_type:complete
MKSIFALIISILIISCSSSKISQPEGIESTDEISTSLIIESDNIYSIEDLIKIGWKKNKKLDNSSFQGTKGIWYGFFNRKDVEIWIYDSHSNAITYGKPYAEKAISKKPTNKDPTNPTEIRYYAYAVMGNILMLCESQLSVCEQLIEKLD